MGGIVTIIQKELRSFIGSDKGVFLVYAIIVVAWSFMFTSGDGGFAGSFWLVFFSVVVAANFSNTVFISERMSGSLEVLITSGLSRDAILFGKMFFVIIMTSIIGLSCALMARIWTLLSPEIGNAQVFTIYDGLLYFSATLLNSSSSAFFSVRLSSPRLLHFINLFILGGIVTFYTVVSQLYVLHPGWLVVTLLIAGTGFTIAARREFAGERIIQPVIL
ncbi:MAG: hypothetical protein ACLFQB_04695 [Chitinispirillaceae bacterium]